MKLSGFVKKNNLMIAAFALSFCALLLLFAMLGVAPFGDRLLIIADSEQQYISFWSYLRQMLLGTQDPVYSLEKTIGGNIIGLLGYYAASPFNLLFLLFSLTELPLAVHLIIVLKLSFCSLSLAYYFKHTTGLKKSSLLFTTVYAFCAYTVSYCWSAMWMDGVILLPLVALGLYRIARGGKPWLYVFSLFAAIVTCYYIGYILCAFSVLYFVYLLFVEHGNAEKSLLYRVGTFSLASVLAGGLSAAVLLPVMLSQVDSKRIPFIGLFKEYTYSRSLMVLEMLCPERAAEHDALVKYVLLAALIIVLAVAVVLFLLLRSKRVPSKFKLAVCLAVGALIVVYGSVFEHSEYFLHKLLVGFTNYDEMFDGLPGIYSGLLTLILLVVYFSCPTISQRKRAGSAFFLAMLLISMRFYIPNLMWHGFTENNCFGYRYSFIFSFFVICLAKEAFDVGRFKIGHGLVTAALTAFLIYLAYHSHPKLAENYQYVLICLVIAVMCAMLYLLGRDKYRGTAFSVLVVLHFVSVLLVPYISWNNYIDGTSYVSFKSRAESVSKLRDEMLEKDPGVYRSMLDTQVNSPMMFGYSGTSHFSSNEEMYVVDFLHGLGIASSGSNWADGNLGKNNAFMSFFGVKYTVENGRLVENKSALPFGFVADGAVINAKTDSDNAFENLNLLFKSAYPQLNEDVFTELDAEKEYVGLRQISDDRYVTEDGFEQGKLVYRFTAQTTDPLYFFSDWGDGSGGELYLNGQYLMDYSATYDWRIVSLGSFEPGEEITLSVKLAKGSGQALTDSGGICSENSEVIIVYHNAITAQHSESFSETDSTITTTVNVDKDGQYLLYTMPYDASWRVLVDGVQVEAERAFGILMAVPVDAGEHIVELNYQAKGIVPGIIISTLSLLFICGTAYIEKKKRSV